MNMDKTKILLQTNEQIKINNKSIKKIYKRVYLNHLIKLEKKSETESN